jgi:hypothetical protein
MKKFIAFLLLIPFFACQQSPDVSNYQKRIYELELRVDSLTNVISSLTQHQQFQSILPDVNSIGKSKKKAKKKAVSLTSASSSYSSLANTGYCHGRTKKGTQCSRRVKSGFYCWQHGG